MTDEQRFCGKCGSAVACGDRFCGGCGSPIDMSVTPGSRVELPLALETAQAGQIEGNVGTADQEKPVSLLSLIGRAVPLWAAAWGMAWLVGSLIANVIVRSKHVFHEISFFDSLLFAVWGTMGGSIAGLTMACCRRRIAGNAVWALAFAISVAVFMGLCLGNAEPPVSWFGVLGIGALLGWIAGAIRSGNEQRAKPIVIAATVIGWEVGSLVAVLGTQWVLTN